MNGLLGDDRGLIANSRVSGLPACGTLPPASALHPILHALGRAYPLVSRRLKVGVREFFKLLGLQHRMGPLRRSVTGSARCAVVCTATPNKDCLEAQVRRFAL